MFQLYQAIIRGSKVYMYLTSINLSNNVSYITYKTGFIIINGLEHFQYQLFKHITSWKWVAYIFYVICTYIYICKKLKRRILGKAETYVGAFDYTCENTVHMLVFKSCDTYVHLDFFHRNCVYLKTKTVCFRNVVFV
jgi:hypothetical protein